MKKSNINKRNVQFLAAAALTAVLVAGQIQPAMVYGEKTEIQVSSLIPDNVTIENPVPLSDIALPSSEYGTLSWVNESNVPSQRTESFDVVFRPYDSAVLPKIDGWDGESDGIYSSVTVVVSSMENEDSSEDQWEEGQDTEQQESEEGYDESDSADDTSDGEESSDENYEDPQDSADPEEEIPVPTVTPGEEETSEPTVTPEEETPVPTVTPGEEDAQEPTVTPEGTPAPTVTPEEEAPEPTVMPEEGETPEPTVTPGEEETPEPTVTPGETIPEPTVTPETDNDNIFDRNEESEDSRPTDAEEDLSEEEQQAAAEENHSCNGISVSGINLPWYVQFRATSGEDYQFTNETEANVFKSYEFELWDLKNNTEYEIPDGEYISVTVPVKAGYSYTIEHLLDSGAMETIVPSVDGSTMVFSTHSFSPFGIAGSRPLVGEEIQEDGYGDTESAGDILTPVPETPSNNTQVSVTAAPEKENGTVQEASPVKNEENSSDDKSKEADSDPTSAVNTGDNTLILPFVILGVAAVVIVGVIIYLKRRKK